MGTRTEEYCYTNINKSIAKKTILIVGKMDKKLFIFIVGFIKRPLLFIFLLTQTFDP